MFDVEENGLPFKRVTSLPRTVTFVAKGQAYIAVLDCTIISAQVYTVTGNVMNL